jgi:hypothetical protein
MSGEELAKICFAARPLLWALAIIAILFAATIFMPQIFSDSGRSSGNEPPSGV